MWTSPTLLTTLKRLLICGRKRSASNNSRRAQGLVSNTQVDLRKYTRLRPNGQTIPRDAYLATARDLTQPHLAGIGLSSQPPCRFCRARRRGWQPGATSTEAGGLLTAYPARRGKQGSRPHKLGRSALTPREDSRAAPGARRPSQNCRPIVRFFLAAESVSPISARTRPAHHTASDWNLINSLTPPALSPRNFVCDICATEAEGGG
jgi:hypothetical protein